MIKLSGVSAPSPALTKMVTTKVMKKARKMLNTRGNLLFLHMTAPPYQLSLFSA